MTEEERPDVNVLVCKVEAGEPDLAGDVLSPEAAASINRAMAEFLQHDFRPEPWFMTEFPAWSRLMRGGETFEVEIYYDFDLDLGVTP